MEIQLNQHRCLKKYFQSPRGFIFFTKLQNMSNVRNQNFLVFLLYRLVENFILRKNPKKKFSEFYRLPLPSGFAGSPNCSKKTFFSYFSKTKSF